MLPPSQKLLKLVIYDFGGVHITLEESKNMATEFIYNLKKQLSAKHPVAGNPLESLLPLADGNICEELV